MTRLGLSEDLLLRTAGETSFYRGEDYVRYVHGLRVVGETAQASIQAKRVYLVDLDWSGHLTGSCTCPHFDQGNFCKHLVALGLAVLDDGPGQAAEAPPHPLSAYVEALGAEQLRELVLELAVRDPEVERVLQLRAAAQNDDPSVLASELTALTTEALRTRGFIDYRASFDVAQRAQALLDELESHLDAGAADGVRPALLKALTRLRTLTLNADDSGGVIGDACQRAADLYARSCRAGNPERVKLARWLVKFRADSPGWPELDLADFVEAFDEKAMAAYRKAVEVLDEKQRGLDHYKRFEADWMLLELADHDGDVDRAIALLSRDKSVDYPGIIDRLTSVGRADEAFDWLERAVAAGRVSPTHGGGRQFWLSPEEVADAYVQRGRVTDALEVQRRAFARTPDVSRFRVLMDLAERVGDPRAERGRAMATLEELAAGAYGSGAPIIRIALAERDGEAAWAAAEKYGAGDAWRELAGALEKTHPGRAAELYQPHVDKQLVHTNSKLYPEIANTLAKMRDLCERSGESVEFAGYLDGIRTRYARRPSLMAALARKGL